MAAGLAGILIPAITGAIGLASTIYGMTQDAPEQAKPGLPSASNPSPVASSAPMTARPFMGRQQTDPQNQRQSAALAMLK